jgi:hypothetical protein
MVLTPQLPLKQDERITKFIQSVDDDVLML